MIRLHELYLRYGDRTLFDGVSAQINSRDRIGLVGANGSGKTTLLRALCGGDILERGEIERARYVTIGHLPQEGIVHTGVSLYAEVESAFDDILLIQKRIEEATGRLDEESGDARERDEILEVIGELEHRLADLEAHKLNSKIKKVLFGLGFSESDMVRPSNEFSGGWQMRIALAKLLLREPVLLLLDEPTNHLDLDSLRWLESYLQGYDGAIVLVSHDRAFLDALCGTIFHLTNCRLDVYRGNYTFFENESISRKQLLLKSAENQRRERAHLQKYVDRFRYKATKAKQAQSRIKKLEKMATIEVDEEESEIGFSFPKPTRSGHVVLKLSEVSKQYGEISVFRDFDLEIVRGDRVAVVGVNGAGKSTLARVLAGAEPFQSGVRTPGHKVELSFFAQNQAEELDPEASVLDLASKGAHHELLPKVRSILGSFLFRGDDVFKKSGVLSGGEKNRLALARMLLRPANCIILDEPTNHLDMRSKEVLQKALEGFPGTLVIVSHDRSFLNPLVNRVLEVTHLGIRSFPGNLSDYLTRLEIEEKQNTMVNVSASGRSDSRALQKETPRRKRQREAEERRNLAPLKAKAERLEQKIARLESAIGECETAMADPAFFQKGEATANGVKRYESLKRKLERAMHEWEATNRKIDKFAEERARQDV